MIGYRTIFSGNKTVNQASVAGNEQEQAAAGDCWALRKRFAAGCKNWIINYATS